MLREVSMMNTISLPRRLICSQWYPQLRAGERDEDEQGNGGEQQPALEAAARGGNGLGELFA